MLWAAPLASTGLDPASSQLLPAFAGANCTATCFHFCLHLSHSIRLTCLFVFSAVCSWNTSAYFKMRSTVLQNSSNSRRVIWWQTIEHYLIVVTRVFPVVVSHEDSALSLAPVGSSAWSPSRCPHDRLLTRRAIIL